MGIGYNGMPIGCSDDELPWQRTAENRLDTKYPYGNITYNCKFCSTEIQENSGSPKPSVASSLRNSKCTPLRLTKNCTSLLRPPKAWIPNCLGCKECIHTCAHARACKHTPHIQSQAAHMYTHTTHIQTQAHTYTQAPTHDTLSNARGHTFSVFLEITLALF